MSKYQTFYNWKNSGLIGDYESIYNIYINTSHCDKCGVLLQGKSNDKKCMDHCHKTGKFRNIVCNRCNNSMIDRNINRNNTSGYRNISFVKIKKTWRFNKIINGVPYQKNSKNINLLHWYKFVILSTKTTIL